LIFLQKRRKSIKSLVIIKTVIDTVFIIGLIHKYREKNMRVTAAIIFHDHKLLIVIELLAYLAEWVDGEIRALEHDDVKWVTVAELDDYEFLPADLRLWAD